MTDFPVILNVICRRNGKSLIPENPANQNAKIDVPDGAISSRHTDQNTDEKNQSPRSADRVSVTTLASPVASSPFPLDGAITAEAVRGGASKPQKKNERLPSVIISPEGRKKLERLASKTNISLSRLCRLILEQGIQSGRFIIPIAPDQLTACQQSLNRVLIELSQQGNNLNQIAANSNKTELRGEPQPDVVVALNQVLQKYDSISATVVIIKEWLLRAAGDEVTV